MVANYEAYFKANCCVSSPILFLLIAFLFFILYLSLSPPRPGGWMATRKKARRISTLTGSHSRFQSVQNAYKFIQKSWILTTLPERWSASCPGKRFLTAYSPEQVFGEVTWISLIISQTISVDNAEKFLKSAKPHFCGLKTSLRFFLVDINIYKKKYSTTFNSRASFWKSIWC